MVYRIGRSSCKVHAAQCGIALGGSESPPFGYIWQGKTQKGTRVTNGKTGPATTLAVVAQGCVFVIDIHHRAMLCKAS